MKGSMPLEKKYPMIRKIGCTMPNKQLLLPDVLLLVEDDFRKAEMISRNGDTSGYFKRKAKTIALMRDELKKNGSNGNIFDVGYEPGLKYIYPGLPLEFAEHVDTAILDVVEIIAECDAVAMTGFCCAGHPSSQIGNPYLEDALEDPKFAAMYMRAHHYEDSIFSHNRNPSLSLLIQKNPPGERLAKELSHIVAEGLGEKAVVDISVHAQIRRVSLPGMIHLAITGLPRLVLVEKEIGFNEFVCVYRDALAGFWLRVQRTFERMVGQGTPEPKPEHFVGAQTDWDREWKLIEERYGNGRRLPNYYYFDGDGLLTLPEFRCAHSLTYRTNHL